MFALCAIYVVLFAAEQIVAHRCIQGHISNPSLTWGVLRGCPGAESPSAGYEG